jgi:hypothetical protein
MNLNQLLFVAFLILAPVEAIAYYLLKNLPTQPQPNPSYALCQQVGLFLKTSKIASATAMRTLAAMRPVGVASLGKWR